MSRDPRIRVRLPLPKIPTIPPFDLRPQSTYNLVLQYPERNTIIMMNLARAVRPGFLFAAALSPKLYLRIGSDIERTPSSSLSVTATSP